MRVEIQAIQNLKKHGATCTLLIIENNFYVLLDCGINHKLDFSRYKLFEKEIQKIDIIIISHSSLEYCGALPFLLKQIKQDI